MQKAIQRRLIERKVERGRKLPERRSEVNVKPRIWGRFGIREKKGE